MSEKILVVDDSLTARRIIVDLLAETPWEIIEAQDGNDGIEKLEANPDIKLIFSDINMPWMNGLEMVGSIKDHETFSQIPICMLTTESSPEALDEAKKLGVNAFLVKPVQGEQLMTVVNSFLK
ncbi:MAG: two-component system response regulator [Zetaproteobacteria bacterium]|nr:two-component system response regulator [Pseudobdellovibrionaceae bacterium]